MKQFGMLSRFILVSFFGIVIMMNVSAHNPSAVSAPTNGEAKSTNRTFEMRIYYAPPGKMKDLQKRFRDHTVKLFEKHGMSIIGFWTDSKEPEVKLIYILAYPSKEAADKSWKAFRDDPEWIKAYKASEVNGKLVEKVESIWMSPTDFSPIK